MVDRLGSRVDLVPRLPVTQGVQVALHLGQEKVGPLGVIAPPQFLHEVCGVLFETIHLLGRNLPDIADLDIELRRVLGAELDLLVDVVDVLLDIVAQFEAGGVQHVVCPHTRGQFGMNANALGLVGAGVPRHDAENQFRCAGRDGEQGHESRKQQPCNNGKCSGRRVSHTGA